MCTISSKLKAEQEQEYRNITVLDRKGVLKDLLNKGMISEDVYTYIIENGILSCPASTRYHGNYEGGLFAHCYEFFLALKEMTDKLDLHWSRPESIGNIAFGHDACKFDNYVKDYKGYIYNENSKLHGHGIKSVVLLQQHCSLTDEEVYCIMYHMGAYEKEQWSAYDKAIKKYPNVLFTHTADMVASKIKGV